MGIDQTRYSSYLSNLVLIFQIIRSQKAFRYRFIVKGRPKYFKGNDSMKQPKKAAITYLGNILAYVLFILTFKP